VPEDRKLSGLVLLSSIRHNLSLPRLARDGRAGLLNGAAERALGQRMVGELDVRPADDSRGAGTLSGGNQQKVVLGKWLGTEPRVLFLDEPTRGVDVAAKAEIHGLIRRLADDGLAVLMASSEMEVLAVPDRVLVMHEGRLAGELRGEALDEQAVLGLATGGGHADGARVPVAQQPGAPT
jgi:ribose transport system ATP-binding protein